MTPRVKVCGVTRLEDALLAVESGVEMIGLNFVSASPRCITPADSRKLVAAIAGRAEVVGVVANESVLAMNTLRREARLDALQLHGDEPPEVFAELSTADYKAVRVGGVDDVQAARCYPGARILVDAKVAGVLGGSGHLVDWNLVSGLARERQLLLAGGLTPLNVGSAVNQVAPWAVDVSSGVENSPGVKDRAKVLAFLRAVREA